MKVLLAALCVLLPALAHAQATADIRGRVLDQQGSAAPGVTVVIRNQETGTFRETVTGAEGGYLIASVVPGRYEVRATLAGFKNFVQPDVLLEVGKTTVVDVRLEVGGVEQAVTVTADAPIVNTTSKEIGGNVTQAEMASLPSFNRNFISYISLLPGIVPTIATDSFGADSIEVNGQDSRNNNYTLDGANNVDDFNGARSGMQVRTPVLSVAEMRVRTNQADAQYGRASGGIVDAITKSGTNSIRGDGAFFFQDSAWTARSYAVKRGNLEKPDTAQRQYAFDIGGPIVRNKLFYYGNLERVENDRGVVMTFANRPDLDYTTTTVERVWNTMAKVDHQISGNHTWSVRYLREQSPQDRQAISGDVTQDAFDAERDTDQTAVGTLTSVLRSTLVNTVRVSFTQEDVTFASPQFFANGRDQSRLLPQLSFDTYTAQQQNGHQARLNNAYQLENTLSWFRPDWVGGDHQIKLGFQYQYSSVKNDNQGNLNGTFTFNTSDADFDPANPRTYPDRFSIRVGGPLRYTQIAQYLTAFVQDDIKRGRLTINAGVRWDAELFNAPQRDPLAFTDLTDDVHPVDWNNVAPRVGFAFDVSGDGRQAIRGGYGLFFQRSYLELYTNLFTSGLFTPSFTVTFPANAADSGPRNGRFPTDPTLVNGPFVTPELRAYVDSLFPTGVLQAQRTIWIDNPDRKTPYQHQATLGYERQVLGNVTVSADYIHSDARDLLFLFDRNAGMRATTDVTSPVVRPNPAFNALNTLVNAGTNRYDGLNLSAFRRMSGGSQVRVSYALGYVRGIHQGTNTESNTFQVGQELNADLNYGPASRDRRHNLSVAGVYAPDFLRGATVSGVYRYLSGTPFTIVNSQVDADRNGSSNEPLPAGSYTGVPVNAQFDRPYPVEFNGKVRGARGPGTYQLDMRFGYVRRIGRRIIEASVDVFNLSNTVRWGNPNGDIDDTDFLLLDAASSATPPRTVNLQFSVRF